MRSFHLFRTGLLVMAMLALAGCGAKLNLNKSVTVQGGESHRLFVDEPLVEKATVTIKSPGFPVNVYVVLQSNEEATLKALDDNKTPKDILTSAEKVEDKSFDVSAGKKPFVLIFTSDAFGKKGDVSVTVTGK